MNSEDIGGEGEGVSQIITFHDKGVLKQVGGHCHASVSNVCHCISCPGSLGHGQIISNMSSSGQHISLNNYSKTLYSGQVESCNESFTKNLKFPRNQIYVTFKQFKLIEKVLKFNTFIENPNMKITKKNQANQQNPTQKSRIRETPTLSTDADSRTDTI